MPDNPFLPDFQYISTVKFFVIYSYFTRRSTWMDYYNSHSCSCLLACFMCIYYLLCHYKERMGFLMPLFGKSFLWYYSLNRIANFWNSVNYITTWQKKFFFFFYNYCYLIHISKILKTSWPDLSHKMCLLFYVFRI